MNNKYIIKNGIKINNTVPISGITDDNNLNGDYHVSTSKSTKFYINSKNNIGEPNSIIYNSGGTLSGTSDLTFNDNKLYVNADINIQSDDVFSGGITNDGGFFINLINETGSPTIKDNLVTYNFNNYFDQEVECLKIQSDGKILAGGYFQTFGDYTSYGIIRLNSDGSIDTSFNSGGTGINAYRHVYSIDIQSDDKILVGGNFTTYNGVTANRIIRLNPDGSIDTSFNSGTGFNFNVHYINIQSDGKILIGGFFTSYNGVTANRIIRLDSDGSIDTSFNNGTGFNSYVYSIDIQSDNKILVGGYFTSYDGTTSNRIIRLNSGGTIDTSFNNGNGFNNNVYSIDIQSDNKILVGGRFTSYDGTTYNRIIRLNSGGTIDTSFNIGDGFNSTVRYVKIQSDGKILVGGEFLSYSGFTANRIIRLDSDGSIDTSFNSGTGFNQYYVYSIDIQSDGKILVGGNFTIYNETIVNKIVRLNSDGSVDNSFMEKKLNSFKYYPKGTSAPTSIPYIGVVLKDNIPNGEYAPVLINGICNMKICSTSENIIIGDALSTYISDVDGEIGYNNPNNSGDLMAARALENGSPGDTIKCLLFDKDLQGSGGY